MTTFCLKIISSNLKFEETNAGSLTTKMVVYGYSTSEDIQQELQNTKGTGLVTPRPLINYGLGVGLLTHQTIKERRNG